MSTRLASQRLCANLEDLLMTDPSVVGGAMAHSSEWIAWAMKPTKNYPERTKQVVKECKNDWKANRHMLNYLKSDTRDGFPRSKVYLHALNYTLQDSFARCSLPLTPGMNLKNAIELRGREPLYKSQMCAWLGYQSRVFHTIGIVNSSSISYGCKSLDESPPDISPTFKRRHMTIQVIHYLDLSKPTHPIGENAYTHEHDDSVGYDAYGFEYYDSFESDDNVLPSNHEFQRKSTDEAEPSDPFRYPVGVQFYQDGQHNTAVKFDEYSKAMPDICLRADEGGMKGVRRIVEASAAVSNFEKRAAVN